MLVVRSSHPDATERTGGFMVEASIASIENRAALIRSEAEGLWAHCGQSPRERPDVVLAFRRRVGLCP